MMSVEWNRRENETLHLERENLLRSNRRYIRENNKINFEIK